VAVGRSSSCDATRRAVDILPIYSNQKLVQFLTGMSCRQIEVLCLEKCAVRTRIVLELLILGSDLVQCSGLEMVQVCHRYIFIYIIRYIMAYII
jgi:hypothetical protein